MYVCLHRNILGMHIVASVCPIWIGDLLFNDARIFSVPH